MGSRLFDDQSRDDQPLGVAAAVAELQATLLSTESLERFLYELTVLAVRAVDPGRLSCGITLQMDGQPATVASSDETAMRLDEIQYGLDSGPCLQALHTGQPVHVHDMSTETRWDPYPAHVLAQGGRALLSLPLVVKGTTFGAMNLYAYRAGAFGEAATARASQLAAQAAGAVGMAVRLSAQTALTEQLKEALASRTVIAQATGIVMAQQQCDPEEAFRVLRKASQDGNVKLREVAAKIVAAYPPAAARPDAS